MSNNIKQASKQLIEAELTKTPCQPIRNLIGDKDIDTAYKVQNQITQQKLSDGCRLVGRKIGLTSFAVQKQLGVNQPDYGMLFHQMEVMNGGEIPWKDCMQPKAEAEIAFVLGKDLNQSQLSIPQIISAIDYALPCIEIVGSRIENWDIKITDTIADNASASHFVIGHTPRKLSDINVVTCKMNMTNNDDLVSQGNGAACMGSPINATWWLAQVMVNLGRPLKAGDLVLAGALGPMVNANEGDYFVADFEGLGSVSVKFGNR